MIGIVTSIQETRAGRDQEPYLRVTFRVRNLAQEWWSAKTDLCPRFANYKKWEPWLKVGAEFHNLSMRDRETVDADSDLIFYRVVEPEELPPDPQMALL